MRYTILLLALCFMTLQPYAGDKGRIQPILLNDLKNGKVADTSTLMDYDHFFQWRMRNESMYKKDYGCTIFFETDKFIYYGLGDTLIYRYYKTSKEKVATLFPQYKSIEGHHLRDIIHEKYMDKAEEKATKGSGSSYNNAKYQYKLLDEKIEVVSELIVNAEKNFFATRRYIWRTVFDTKDLSVISNDTLKYGKK